MADWYVMRATGVVSLVLLTLVTALGIATARGWRPGRAPRFLTLLLHRNLSLLAVVFVAVHVVTALFDQYSGVTLASVVVPFAAHWRPLYVGLGTVSLDLLAAVIATSLLRLRLGFGMWRSVHLLAYVSWPVAVVHTLGSGTDASTPWLRALTLGCIALVVAVFVARVVPRKRLVPQVAR